MDRALVFVFFDCDFWCLGFDLNIDTAANGE